MSTQDKKASLLDELKWRGMIHSDESGSEHYTPGLPEELLRAPITAYIGFDPTADSLHVGSLLQIMTLVHLQRHGHKPIAVVGGATGLIGDPSGKSTERPLLTREVIDHNVAGIRSQLERFLDFDSSTNPAQIINNAEWFDGMSTLEFLRDVGKHFPLGYMLQKESVQRRLGDEGDGISFTEFSYMLLQAYDFLVLHERRGCRLQVGGSDQWGNITAGIELTRRVWKKQVHGLVTPLVKTSTGEKFGKTNAGTIWLDPARTSPFRFYQFWLNSPDSDVVSFLKFFTLLDAREIADLERAVVNSPAERTAQRVLAEEVTRAVHGEEGLRAAERATDVLFNGGEVSTLAADDVEDVFSDVPSVTIAKDTIAEGMSLVELVVTCGLVASKAEARRVIESGGVQINSRRCTDSRAFVDTADSIGGKFLLLRRGAREYRLIQLGYAPLREMGIITLSAMCPFPCHALLALALRRLAADMVQGGLVNASYDPAERSARSGEWAHDEDWALLNRARSDVEAFGRLYDRYAAAVLRYIAGYVGETHAEDLAEDVWLRLYEGRDRWVPRAPFAGFLFRSAYFRVLDHVRLRRYPPPLSIDELAEQGSVQIAASGTDPEFIAEHKSEVEDVEGALETVFERRDQLGRPGPKFDSDSARTILTLKDRQGLTFEEVAAATGRSVGSAKVIHATLHREARRIIIDQELKGLEQALDNSFPPFLDGPDGDVNTEIRFIFALRVLGYSFDQIAEAAELSIGQLRFEFAGWTSRLHWVPGSRLSERWL